MAVVKWALLVVALAGCSSPRVSTELATEYRNGRLFDGTQFVAMWVVGALTCPR